ncbi:NAD(P)H-dependent oxidoreductase [Acetanaerobacterium elongatum]|uniref:Flavodoxin-like fold n=1 Tax=Acetanaerobacterium elongatum TaxID=258515 RepID=A0A1H0DF48_9FIRM|nr:NAD(P)H-dependent oxidoreductase [Acetanaerobacterium elongatum]SDN68795.1 Flavodoxin-like fold [Acetanaerobacterium elongatum]
MKITVFDLGKDAGNEPLAQAVKNYYIETNPKAEVVIHNYSETEIKDCRGCWSCWWKTPGQCALRDADNLYRDYMNSDEVVLLFNTENGFINGKGKTFLDRAIQHYMPYIHIRNGECGHLKRYDKYPVMNFYFEKNGLSAEEAAVIRCYLARTAYHFSSTGKELVVENEGLRVADLEDTKPMDEVLSNEVAERKTNGKWVIYNGSPRGTHSNSRLMIEQIITGMRAQGAEDIEVRDLIDTKEHKTWAETFSSSENNLFVFPLYVHAMPGLVMKFFEQLKPVNNKKVHMAFLVQSGFPETSQSYYLRPYLELLTKRLGTAFDGTIIRGNVEGIQQQTEKQNKKFFDELKQIGETYASKGIMDVTLKKEYEKMAYLPKAAQVIFSILSVFGVTNGYWNSNLKKNGAYEKRYARPYME